jgi:hypothetical protein
MLMNEGAEQRIPNRSGRSLDQEIQGLLELAEELDKNVEMREDKIAAAWFRLGGALGGVVAAAAMFAFLAWGTPKFLTFALLVSAGGFIVCAILIISFRIFLAREMQLKHRDTRALWDVVDILREVGDSTEMTALARAEYRVRLARFDIGRGN